MNKIEDQKKAALQAVSNSSSIEELEALKIQYIGKEGIFKLILRDLGGLPPEQKREVGATANSATQAVTNAIILQKGALEAEHLTKRLERERVDLSLPSATRPKGGVHPTMQVMDEMIAIFADMGFEVAEGPDIEDDFHNFTALNFPEKHPAREMHDTFFFHPNEGGVRKLLRTHTSPVQIRTMISGKPPFRLIVPGRVFRNNSDQTHTPMFHQIEGLVIDKTIHMGHLKWVFDTFIARFFETDKVITQFRPHHFPFTEPSAEMDVRYTRNGNELKIGDGDKWMEILGSGMVHPNVLTACGIDPNEYQGFAFGMGVDRLAMLKYGVPDLRDMFAADTRWLNHYGFSGFSAPNSVSGLS
ncbi:phenylalanine--tRNA ligase subunit alpha [Asticcacaulis sp. ZE23SCel15]|uniref:phenylalanine--tRNA ligase subunit alpha n=1 Tax=Asticcacaulis sp. ZE23SCel15 TaxID=3059027 RepID=UPI00265F7562|nr:phenylalanine--tRNA ligase subunit alpha [Asticcacaulis sp. ZE23SCel15]WKL58515.1 phenylalanine--tRNA ligase subunit alpha [Asticcacaulis sp. ZE23SCel15]